ncbi:BNR repeat protein [Rhodococcus wratislaviensis]|uniref:Predicted neuraminidase (Sialidase) n=1 Tax=Rhodococcus wratislaviensis TaxID=44752 RepID=A0AB38FD00_RHOWR|nr:sialidase family protein [Rhodococcus wratislaviensis]REE75466.1 BNR repeat protein [Rhodococcus wratislaviensis]SPZ39500.1 Predicted neuraminidase (sialidase) [Rhodococcus wratislaviensis]
MPLDATLTPAEVLDRPQQRKYLDPFRQWQGIPSIERTRGGRLYVNFYTGEDTEKGGNFVVVDTSDDNGATWEHVRFVVSHPDPEIRAYDPCLWADPLGRLWMTWNQSRDFFDGRVGVWVSICENPDDSDPQWSPPRRIGNGLMMNKPTVTAAGEWLFPTAIWACHPPTEDHPDMADERFSNVYVTTDQGRTFHYRGGADVPNRSFDEHMIVEKQDGALWMLVRCFDGIGESYSVDGGATWEPGKRSHIDGPCSRFHIRRLASGRLLMINHVGFNERSDRTDIEEQGNVKAWKGRSHLSALLSEDDGRTWPYALLLDERDDVSYPDATEGTDGYIYVTYDWERFAHRNIYLARFTEDDILKGTIHDERSATAILVNHAGALSEKY